ncbi:MAG: family 20 glycosylhydrolase, partial [Oscillospiraceae bacterium]|nr:family 20 glycosylhydrolase [Oscillospiraceae bacterium]
MKKILALILIPIMLFTCLTGCGLLGGGKAVVAENAGLEGQEILQLLTSSYEKGTGKFTLKKSARIYAVGAEAQSPILEWADFFAQQFAGAGLPSDDMMKVAGGALEDSKKGDILLVLDEGLEEDAYELCVDKEHISISGGSRRGLMYGVFMLIKAFRTNGSRTLKACTITDTPDAGERVVMLDCGRKYYTKDWICNFIRQSAFMGYNAIELRFSEDQGTRFDIWDPEYYKTNVNGNDFSWLCGGYVGSWVKWNYQEYEDMKMYLRASEIHEIMMVAKEYSIDVIPAFNGPGHCQYMCRSFEGNSTISLKYNYQGKTYSYRGVMDESGKLTTVAQMKETHPAADFTTIFTGNHITLDVTNPFGRNFALAVVEDYGRFFKQYGCETIHIGGDEVRLHTNDYGSVDWADYVQPGYSKYDTCIDYINEETALLKSMGYKVRAYNDFMDYVSDDPDYDQHLEYDPDIELSYWVANYDLETAAPLDHWLGKRKIYNCMQNYCYYSLT